MRKKTGQRFLVVSLINAQNEIIDLNSPRKMLKFNNLDILGVYLVQHTLRSTQASGRLSFFLLHHLFSVLFPLFWTVHDVSFVLHPDFFFEYFCQFGTAPEKIVSLVSTFSFSFQLFCIQRKQCHIPLTQCKARSI